MLSDQSFKLKFNSLILILIASGFIGVAISFSDIYLFHVISFFTIILFFYNKKQDGFRTDISIFYNFYISPLILIFLWYSISLFWAPSTELGLKYIFYVICGTVLTLSVVSYSNEIEKLNKVYYLLSTFVFLEIAIALIESFSSLRMPISSYSSIAAYFGKEPVNFSEQEIISLSKINPPTGFRWNTNDLAICMVIALPFFLCNKKNIIRIFGIVAITTIVVMSASRAVFLSLILTYSVYLFFVKKRIGTLFFTWFVSLAILLSMFQLRDSENPRINEIANSIQALSLYLTGDIDIGGSLEWRRELVSNGLDAFLRSYGLGLGAGGSIANQEIIGPVAGRFTSMHNFWIELLVEGGIVVAMVILFWIGHITYKLFVISKINNENQIIYYSQSCFLSIIAFIPAAISASSTIYFFPMWIMFGLAISVILISDDKSKRNN